VGAVFAVGVLLPRLLARCVPETRARRVVLVGLVLLAAALYAADQRVLPRLYPFFHRGLEALAIGVLAIALAIALGARRRAPAMVAVLVVAGGLGGVLLARAILRGEAVVATVLGDRAPAAATLALLFPRPPPRPVAPAAPDALDRARGLPPGPHLGTRDIVLVTVDAWRADRMTAAIAPNMASLAERGVRFADAYTQVPHTSFALATLLTGKYVHALSALGLDAASHETLAQVFRRERFKTAAFYPPAVFFIDHERLLPLERSAYGFEYVKYEYMEANKRTDQVIDFFERERPARALVWVHYFEPHEPYEVHPGETAGTPGAPPAAPERPPAEVRYEGEIRHVDAAVGRLLDYLRRTRPGALVVLAADHGEEFGEHGGRYHGTTLFGEQVHVPLVFATLSPSGLQPRTVRGPVGLIDVAPTVLALLGVPSSARMRGRDLSPWMVAGPPPPSALLGPAFAEIDRKKMVVDGDDKLICDLETGACALYDLVADAGERRDASGRKPEALARLRGLLERFLVGESRYERRAPAPPGLERVFERARLGDAAVTPALVEALPGMPAAARGEALRLLVELPPDPTTGAALGAARADDEDGAALLDLLRARLGDVPAQQRLRALLTRDATRAEGDPARISSELFARGALAVADVELLVQAVDRTDERELVIALAEALSRTHDPRALDALLIALAPVRSRAEVVDALRVLGDARAVEPLARWLPADPYVPVRAAMVRALAALGPGAGPARAALVSQLSIESEPPVLTALCEALPPARYGAVRLAPVRGDVFSSAQPDRELLVLGEGKGEAAVVGAAPGRAPLVDGRARLKGVSGRVQLSAGVRGLCVVERPIPPGAAEEAPTRPAP
jgi:arylsulfatase A-like enzyme